MRSMQWLVTCALTLSLSVLVDGQSDGRVTFKDALPEEQAGEHGVDIAQTAEGEAFNRSREGKNLFDWIGLGTGRKTDPYMARTNEACLTGDLAQCFKSQALGYFSDFFGHDEYKMSDHVRVVRLSKSVVKSVNREPYEFSSEPRSADSEWDQLLKFALRKAEKFVKTSAFEISVPSSETGVNDVYAPRFLDEIADEIDTLENKKDTLFSRQRFKRLLIPILLVLKLFKIKLLLFLPLILGLASFKKFLAFMAFVIPGLIGFFKLYKPFAPNYQPPVYGQNGIGYPYYKENSDGPHIVNENAHHHEPEYAGSYHGGPVSFGQDLAYQGYREYRS